LNDTAIDGDKTDIKATCGDIKLTKINGSNGLSIINDVSHIVGMACICRINCPSETALRAFTENLAITNQG
jgi:hypothetical protein